MVENDWAEVAAVEEDGGGGSGIFSKSLGGEEDVAEDGILVLGSCCIDVRSCDDVVKNCSPCSVVVRRELEEIECFSRLSRPFVALCCFPCCLRDSAAASSAR